MSSRFPLVTPAGLVTPLVTPSDLLQARWHNLACVKCLEMSKPMVVGFVLLVVDATLVNESGI